MIKVGAPHQRFAAKASAFGEMASCIAGSLRLDISHAAGSDRRPAWHGAVLGQWHLVRQCVSSSGNDRGYRRADTRENM